MLKSVSFLLAICIIIGCREDEPPPVIEPSLPLSQFVLTSGNDTLYNVTYSACDRSAPIGAGTIGNGSSLILFSPGMFLPDHVIDIPEDFFFDFIFHGVDIEYFGTPSLDEFWTYVQNNSDEFNQKPFTKDFFLKVKKDGKAYQNWWNGELLAGFGHNISQDETGLAFKNYEFNKFEEFGDICFYNYYAVMRLEGDIEGYLITEDRNDTLNVEGHLDVFLHLRE